jgi:metal-sulfur cluster biosynthetic enzyme
MSQKPTVETVKQAIAEVEHPEISSTLTELGMVENIRLDEETDELTITLMLPTMGVPEEIRNYLLQSIAQAVQEVGVKSLKYDVAEMDEASKQSFFSLAQAGWKL